MKKALRDKTFDDNMPVVVSICTITYNHSKFITECVEGFLDQECDFRVEIIIIILKLYKSITYFIN